MTTAFVGASIVVASLLIKAFGAKVLRWIRSHTARFISMVAKAIQPNDELKVLLPSQLQLVYF
jgi:hypothetical protein